MQGSSGDKDIENRCMNMGSEEEGEDKTNGESRMEAYTLTSVKYIANGNLLYDTGNSNWGSRTT